MGEALVESWYDAHSKEEENRLEENKVEFEVTMRVIGSCILSLKLKHAKILDVGGGPGKYAIALTKQLHNVTLTDISVQSLEIAKSKARTLALDLDAVVHVNALSINEHKHLSAYRGSFDIVLCLGPLYHLINREDREGAVTNAISMARHHGYILLAYVSVYAHLRDIARRDPSRLASEPEFYGDYLRNGAYTRNAQIESFHTYPSDIREELNVFSDQVEVDRVLSAEGFLGADSAKRLATLPKSELDAWINLIMTSADEGATLNSADHLLVVLRKH